MAEEYFAGLDDIDWSALEHAYGPAADVPAMLRALVSAEQEERDEGLDGLWGAVHHQGDVYDSTIAAVPFVIRLALDPAVPARADLLQLLASIGESVPAAVADGLDGFLDALADPDEAARCGAAAVLGVCRERQEEIRAAVLGTLERSGRAAGLPGPGASETAALIDAAMAAGASGTDWLLGLWERSRDPQQRLAVLTRIAAHAPAALPAELASVVGALVDAAYTAAVAEATEPEPAGEPAEPAGPEATQSSKTLVAALRAQQDELESGQTVPWVGELLDALHRALGARRADRAALAAYEMDALAWERRYHGARMGNWIVERLRGDHTELVRQIGRQLLDPEKRLRYIAEISLKDYGAVAAPAADAIAAHLEAYPGDWQEAKLVPGSVEALAALRDPRVLPALRHYAEREEPPNLSTLLSAAGPAAAEFAGLARAALARAEGGDRRQAISVLGAMGQAAAAAVPDLLALLGDASVAGAAAHALARIAPEAPEVGEALARAAASGLPHAFDAAIVLARLRPDPSLAEVFVGHLDSGGRRGCDAADGLARVVEGSGVRLPAGIAERARGGGEPDPWGRLAAGIALHAVEGDAQGAAETFAAVWDTSLYLRTAVARRLPQLGAHGRELFAERLPAELAEPVRIGYRRSQNTWSNRDVPEDEELQRLCRDALG